MRTKLFFSVILIFFLSCTSNNKSLTDAQKEIIKGEVKEVMNKIVKGAEEANIQVVTANWLDSPDFVFTYNGNVFDYQQSTEMGKSVFGSLISQKLTSIDEKFAVLDHLTVLYTANVKCTMNLKDSTTILQDPWVMQYLFKKISNEWKVLSANESGVEKTISGEPAKVL